MSGNLAAIRLKGCCCKKDEDDNPQPDECGSSSEGAESDRATTAISLSLDMSVTEFVVRNWLGGQITVGAAFGKNCVIWNGSACEFEYPNGDPYNAYWCDGNNSAAATRPLNSATDFRGGSTCYNQTGNSNHVSNFVVAGTQCTCSTQGNCTACTGDSYTLSGGGAILDQVSPNAREWRTYQRSTQMLPDHRVGEWTWRPGLKGTRTVSRVINGVPTTRTVRLFCSNPLLSQYYVNSFFQFGGTPNIPAGPHIDSDPAGMFVDVSQPPNGARTYPYANGRWGNADVGRIYVCVDATIRYLESYTFAGQNLGPGWRAEVQLFSVFREQHLDLRHRFTMGLPAGSTARWHLDSTVPDEPGYPFGNVPTGFRRWTPWLAWKPCTGGDDTVAGTYQTLGQTDRDYYMQFFDDCTLAGFARGEASFRSMVVS